jgi:predicted nucleotidyltransferase
MEGWPFPDYDDAMEVQMAVALSDQQQEIIREAMTRRFGDGVMIWVFGSRAQGVSSGDIDLYAETSGTGRPRLVERLLVQSEIQDALKTKVDLIVRPSHGEKRAFEQMAKSTGVLLYNE